MKERKNCFICWGVHKPKNHCHLPVAKKHRKWFCVKFLRGVGSLVKLQYGASIFLNFMLRKTIFLNNNQFCTNSKAILEPFQTLFASISEFWSISGSYFEALFSNFEIKKNCKMARIFRFMRGKTNFSWQQQSLTSRVTSAEFIMNV